MNFASYMGKCMDVVIAWQSCQKNKCISEDQILCVAFQLEGSIRELSYAIRMESDPLKQKALF